MRFVKSAMMALLGAALVAGCGGGGGGGSSAGSATPVAPGTGAAPPVAADGSWLTFTPGSVAITAYQGETPRFEVRAKSSRTFDKPFNVGIIDSKGLVSSQVSLSKQSDLEYIVGLATLAQAAGTYTTSLQVRLCEDDPRTCSKPLPGSPWTVPVTLNVLSVADAQGRMTFSPAALDMLAYEGEAASMQLGLKVNSIFDVPVSVRVSDSGGVIAPDVVLMQDGRTQYRAQLTSVATLAQGEHTSLLEVRMCYDDARECKSPVVGSPWRVPVKVTVKPGTNLTTLAAIPAVGPWSNQDGNAAHTAHVAASFDPARFTRRWSKKETDLGLLGAPAIVDGKLFTVRGSRFGNSELIAIDEASGGVMWRNDMGAAGLVTSPAVMDGNIFVNSTANIMPLTVFDQSTGQRLSGTMTRTMSECRAAMTVAGGAVYTSFNRIAKFNPATGAFDWDNASALGDNLCAPSVEGSLAYAYVPNQLVALNTADGSVAYTIADQGAPLVDPVGVPVVLGDGMGFVINGKRLLGFDLRTRTRAWLAEATPVGQPVFANGTVYALAENGAEVEARAAATGIVQWKSAGLLNWSLNTPYERMVVTSNLLFVSGPAATVALDLASHQVVWSYPLGGELAISDRGVLYIFAASGKQAAINLR